MHIKCGSLWLCLAAFILCPSLSGAENLTIQIHLFQGAHVGLKQTEVLLTSSRPELSLLKEKAVGSENELTAAILNTLMEIYELHEVEDLFSFKKGWNRKVPLMDESILGKLVAYRLKISPKMLPSQEISLRGVISKTKEGSLQIDKSREKELSDAYIATRNDRLMECIVDQEVILNIGDPVIVSVPFNGRTYFMAILVTIGEPSAQIPGPEKSKKTDLVPAPNVILQVRPSYPDELRRRRIGGEIGLRVMIDEKGIVRGVDVIKQVHPYLNYSAVQAFLKWKFEPVLRLGKTVGAAFLYSYNFDPLVYSQETAWSEETPKGMEPSLEKVRTVLDRCADYCGKLAGAVMDFVCEERIKETHYSLLKNLHWGMLIVRNEPHGQGGWLVVGKPIQIMDPKLTKRNDFLCDYQIVRKGGRIDERRFILKENGHNIAEQKKLLEEKRFSGLSSLFASLRILLKDQQSRFNFRIIDEEKTNGKRAYVIEAIPKSGDEDGIWSAKIWIDKESFQILKIEIEGVPIDGYEDILNDCAILNIKPFFVMTHEYQMEKNGVLFPSRSKIHAAYPGIDYQGPVTKNEIDLTYGKYKFLTVDTDSRIIK
jgi:TonB family protein